MQVKRKNDTCVSTLCLSLALFWGCVIPAQSQGVCQQALEEQQRLRLENQALQQQVQETSAQVQALQQQLKQLSQLQQQWLDYWQQLEP